MTKSNSEFSELRVNADISKYSRYKRIQIRLFAIILYWTMNIIGKTVRFQIEGWTGCEIPGWESFESALPNRPITINAFWHDRIFLMTYFWRNHGTSVMVSKSFDGEYISRAAQKFGYGVIRGSSTRGGSEALKKMVSYLRHGETMTITVDGPRGPRYKVKTGAIILAAKTGVPIVPVLIETKSRFILNSWDKLQIPFPFTKARVFIGTPIFVEPDQNAEYTEQMRLKLQSMLDEMVYFGEQWRDSKN